jgi:hypothetical protein
MKHIIAAAALMAAPNAHAQGLPDAIAAPGATAADIPLLKLEIAVRRGQGALSEATTIQRIKTRGGQLEGACDKAGDFRSVAYSTDYVFLKK